MNLELGPQQTPNLLVILDFLSSRIARNKCLLFISEKLMLINLNTKYSPWDLESAQQMRQACKLEGCSLGSAQSSSVISNSVTPWNAACQSPSITNSWSLLKLISLESVTPSNHLILCRPFLLLPSIIPRIVVFSASFMEIFLLF